MPEGFDNRHIKTINLDHHHQCHQSMIQRKHMHDYLLSEKERFVYNVVINCHSAVVADQGGQTKQTYPQQRGLWAGGFLAKLHEKY